MTRRGKTDNEILNEMYTPPHNIEAERQLLGAIMLSSDVLGEALENVDSRYFYLDSHKKVFEAAKRLFIEGEIVDAITISEDLKSGNLLDQVGGISYLSELCSDVTSPTSALYYIEILRKNAVLRDLIKAGQEIIKLGYSQPPEDTRSILDMAESIIYSVSSQRISDRFSNIEDLIHETYDYLDRIQNTGLEAVGIPTGFRDLDKLLLGLHPSDLIIIAARPAMGKTSLTLSIALNVSINHNIPVGIFSLETSKLQLTQRLISSEALIASEALRTGRIPRTHKKQLIKAMEKLAKAPIFIDDTPSISSVELRTKARRLKSKEDVQLIIVDYLQLMEGDSRADSRQQQISDISRSLKILGRELDIPIIAVSQLSRKVEDRTEKRPMLSDLRESGAIEQDADVVIFIYREDYYNKNSDDREAFAEIIVAKHRNGPTGSIKLIFEKEYTRFYDPEVPESY